MNFAMDALKTYLAFCEIPWRPAPPWALVFKRKHPEGISVKAEDAPFSYIEEMDGLSWKNRGDSIYIFPKG